MREVKEFIIKSHSDAFDIGTNIVLSRQLYVVRRDYDLKKKYRRRFKVNFKDMSVWFIEFVRSEFVTDFHEAFEK